jgi:acetone carboxylase gamma subunit
MTEYTQEELDRIVAEKVAQAQNLRDIANYGHTGFVIAIEYLQDQVKRNMVPVQVLQVMQMVHQTFLKDTAYQQIQPPEPAPEA